MKRIAALLIFVFSVASAQSFFEPNSIIVNPRGGVDVDVWVDKDPNNSFTPSYEIGDRITVGVSVGESAYVYVFDIDANDVVTQIFPNRYSSDNYLRGGSSRNIPASADRFSLTVDGPRGEGRVVAVASRKELSAEQLTSFASSSDAFRTYHGGVRAFVDLFGIVVEPIPTADWSSATAYYRVGSGSSQPVQTGTVRVESIPRGANVEIDGRYVGTTPNSFSVNEGSRTVVISSPGYSDYRTSVSVRAGQTTTVSARLAERPIPQEADVTFDSQPRGADVYLDGRYMGTTPLTVRAVSAGLHNVEFRLSGYDTYSTSFTVRAGQNSSVDARLQARRTGVVVQANVGGALVFIDGRQVGTIPSGSGRLEILDLASGSYELVVIAPGYSTHVGNVRVNSGQVREINVRQNRL